MGQHKGVRRSRFDTTALPLRPQASRAHVATESRFAGETLYEHTHEEDECLACDAERAAGERPREVCWDDDCR